MGAGWPPDTIFLKPLFQKRRLLIGPRLSPSEAGFPHWSAPMETTDSLEALIRLQGEIKWCRELAEQTTDDRFALMLYRLANDVEQRAREIDW
jgi:hypothetical protein